MAVVADRPADMIHFLWQTAYFIDRQKTFAKIVPPRNVTAPDEAPPVPVRLRSRAEKRRARRR